MGVPHKPGQTIDALLGAVIDTSVEATHLGNAQNQALRTYNQEHAQQSHQVGHNRPSPAGPPPMPPHHQSQAPNGELSQRYHSHPKTENISAKLAALVSVIALLFSSYSFYETVLKQPELKAYAPPISHMFREGFRDVLAIPVTISNDGARRGTVLSFDLQVTHQTTGEVKKFQNLYIGESPKSEKQMFHPITIAGRSSYSDVILFHATKTGAFFETTGGVKLPLSFKLSMNIEKTGGWLTIKQPQELNFNMTTNYIQSFSNMERGKPTTLYNKNWQQAAD